MWKTRFSSMLAVLSVCASQSAFAAEAEACKLVRMADPGWSDIGATNAAAGIVLAALGYEQRVAHLSVPITFIGLKKGQIDIFLGNWMPAQKPLMEAQLKDGAFDIMHANLVNAKFTLAVPSYVAAAGVKSFKDLARFADKFDSKIYGIETGAPANQNIKTMLDAKSYGLAGWKLVESSEQSMLSQVARKVAAKEWIVFLAWEPHLMNSSFQLTYLDGGDAYFGPNYGGASVNTLARKSYRAQCPNVGRLFSQLEFSVDMENKIINDVLAQKVDAKTAAARQLKLHPELLQAWLNGVKTRGGEDGLPAVKQVLGLN
ncbi:choline ABC transporter substrate-binding protein [Collimonas pratensis]|uniref:choline ABC transporter substrate-binding protein n=1 Tax=Collimonas pratensis TaxID=279113 RepID=UPI00143CD996|nr:choline ABC transporter substrate-binding protein [Collimonas pratensis]NKI70143.1 choline ABC transporter substrate-binding protein [Collimonas pratensis]